MSRFIQWLNNPRADRGIYLATDRTGWTYITYREFAASAHDVGSQLVSTGIGPGDVVCIILANEYESLTALFGAWAAGATVCPLPPPSIQPEDEYVRHIAAILKQAEPSVTLTSLEFEPLIARATELAALPAPLAIDRLPDQPMPFTPRIGTGIALLQFTSGSTGTPRGVRVSWDNLEANFAVASRWTAFRDGDAFASWLPLYHDMGLIGCLLPAAATQSNLWLLQPIQFIRDPARWLECFGPGRASISATPPSALAYTARRVTPERLKDLDLSGWRCAIIGAETIDPVILQSFTTFAAPAGFSARTYLPSYGLAENTVAVTCAHPDDDLPMVLPDWDSIEFGRDVRILDQANLSQRDPSPGSGWLLGHGQPLPADMIGVQILTEDGQTLPENHLGEITVTGTSVAHGYHKDQPASLTRFSDGTLRTGDAGFIHNGQLFILGRMGDSLQLHGRNIYVEDLDAKVAAAAGLGGDRVSIVSTCDHARTGVAAFVEAKPGPWTVKVIQKLRAELGPDPTLIIIAGTRGLIRRTSSGKPRRQHMWQLLQSGRLTGATVIET